MPTYPTQLTRVLRRLILLPGLVCPGGCTSVLATAPASATFQSAPALTPPAAPTPPASSPPSQARATSSRMLGPGAGGADLRAGEQWNRHVHGCPMAKRQAAGLAECNQRLAALEQRLGQLEAEGGLLLQNHHERLNQTNQQAVETSARLWALEQRIDTELSCLGQRDDGRITTLQQECCQLRARLGELAGHVDDAATISARAHTALAAEATQTQHLLGEVVRWTWRLLLVASILLLLALMLTVGAFGQRRRSHRIAAETASRPSVQAVQPPADPGSGPPPEEQAAGALSPGECPTQAVLFDQVLAACKTSGFVNLPELSTGRWGLGLQSVRGPVRQRHEDRGLAFVVGGYRTLVSSDGCGGHPLGDHAAHLAARAAALSIVREINALSPGPLVEQMMASRAVFDAAAALADAADAWGLEGDAAALRTTLIVVISGPASMGFCHIGDGGGVVVRGGSGAVESFLRPQKDPEQPSVLAASLGPTMVGGPLAGFLPLAPGDLLAVGSDGVFDRMPPEFALNLLHGAILHGGDLQALANQVVEELAQATDDSGFVADDNMTIGIMGTGAIPPLPPGFWNLPSRPSPSSAPNPPRPSSVGQSKPMATAAGRVYRMS